MINSQINMKKFFISKNYSDKFTASSKAKIDAEEIAKQKGYKNIGFYRTYYKGFLGKFFTLFSFLIANLRMPKNGILFVQYPISFDLKQIKNAKNKNNKIIILIHDLNQLRQNDNHNIEAIKLSDIIIVHTPAMKDYLLSQGYTQEIRILQIFDYLNDTEIKKDKEKVLNYTISFAGNLQKSTFISNLTFNKVKLKLFGIGIENIKLNKGVEYVGCFPPNKLLEKLNTNFGLVWDGESVDSCEGALGNYLRYISPHKFSMYIAAGIPLIVWSKSALAEFVIENQIGIVIDSLNDLEKKISEISQGYYNFLCINVSILQKKVNKGFFLSAQL